MSLTTKQRELASLEARPDPMARQPALEHDIANLQNTACAAVGSPASCTLLCTTLPPHTPNLAPLPSVQHCLLMGCPSRVHDIT